MRAVVQRVSNANVTILGKIHASIETGLLLFLGVEEADNEEDVIYLASKICALRIFSDEEGKMNLDIKQVNGDMLVISQFTLHASTKKGNRPSFIKAAHPDLAMPLYRFFITAAEGFLGKKCKCGKFGADMKVSLLNDGPVTIILDSKNKE